ncbi:MAG TPA: S41 family peptidase [Rhodanobacteraceae bacterium]|nr:S41 family peptidase [Rhodanobacteraceae bacterium]
MSLRKLLLSLVLLACSSVALAAPPATVPAPASSKAPPETVSTPAAASSVADTADADTPDLADIRAFTRVYAMVKQAYVDKVSDKKLMQSAIRGMLAGLDPHSDFLDTSDLKDLTEDTTGAYSGLGIEVAQLNDQLRIVAPIDGTPAARAGIKSGDVIVSINGKTVQPDALDAAVKQLRGPPGSKITLGILHADAKAPVTIPLTRERIHVGSVKVSMLDPGYAYIRISQFQEDTASDLDHDLDQLQKKSGPLRGAVLDLRSNPGGLLTAAVGVSDAFLDSGTIVSTKGRLKEADLNFSATPGDLLNGAPMVVLVDNGTASAAEIVAGALKDNHRALLMGQRTFGKGSVQTILPLSDDEAIKLTTARYYTPDGASIQAAGITPDITLGNLTVSTQATTPGDDEHESDLPNHLAGNTPVTNDAVAAQAGKLAVNDYALSEALHVLKGLALARPVAAPATSKH